MQLPFMNKKDDQPAKKKERRLRGNWSWGRMVYTTDFAAGPALRNDNVKTRVKMPYVPMNEFLKNQQEANRERVKKGEGALPVTRVIRHKRKKPINRRPAVKKQRYFMNIAAATRAEIKSIPVDAKIRPARLRHIKRLQKYGDISVYGKAA